MTDHETPPPTSHSSRAVARYDGPRTTAELQTYAQLLAVNTTPDGRSWRNEALPATFRGNPAAVAFAVEYAKALDVSPVTALIGIHIVDGKPTASAGLISALVRRAGHKIRTWLEGSIDEGTAKAITTIHRADDPDFEYRSEWDLGRAIRAQLMKRTPDGRVVAAKDRSAWATYPENMLKARSVTECARDAAEDAILGVHYTPEELGAEVDETGDVVYTVTQVPPTPGDAPIPPGTPDEKREEASSEVDVEQLAADAREGILEARDLDALTEVWKGPAILADTNRAAMLVTADEKGEETTVLDLFRRAAKAIQSGTPLVPDPDDGTPAEPAAGGGDPSGDGDQGEDVVDGEVVEEGGSAENDTGGPETEEAKGSQPAPSSPSDSTSNRDDLRAIWRELSASNPVALEDVKAYANASGIDPANLSEEDAGNLVEAIATGQALRDNTIRETLDETPLELVARILGGTVVRHEPVTDPAELHRRELEERREEDRREAADVAHPGTGHPDREAAKKAAREGIARAKSTRK